MSELKHDPGHLEDAIEAAITAANKAAGKAWHTGENITVAMVQDAISAYLTSVGSEAIGFLHPKDVDALKNKKDISVVIHGMSTAKRGAVPVFLCPHDVSDVVADLLLALRNLANSNAPEHVAAAHAAITKATGTSRSTKEGE
jgi:hypothetical protein